MCVCSGSGGQNGALGKKGGKKKQFISDNRKLRRGRENGLEADVLLSCDPLDQ